MSNYESLAASLEKAYGLIIHVEGLGSDFEARGTETDGFTLLHKHCGNVVGRFTDHAQPEAIKAAQDNHWCPEHAEGIEVG